jgi:hypothetical protein
MSPDMDVSPIVVDIETCGLPNAADFLEPVTPDGRLTDPKKIEADIKAKEEARNQKLALDWNVGCVAAVGWWTECEGLQIRLCQGPAEEAAALGAFWMECRHRTIVGFNVKGFDLKFMVQRSRYLGIHYPILDFSKYSRKGITDLFLDLTFSDGAYDQGCMRRTLHAFCKRFGIPVTDPVKGADIPALVARGEWESVAGHVGSDVLLTVQLAHKLGVIREIPVPAEVVL